MSKCDWSYEVKGIGDTGGFGTIADCKPTEALKKLTKLVAKHNYEITEVTLIQKPHSKPSVVSK